MKQQSSKQKKSYTSRLATAKELGKHLKGTMFEIEKKPPPAVSRQQSQEHLKFREKVKVTAESTQVGMAMIIPAVGKKIARDYLNKMFPDYKFVINTIIDNDKQVRLYKQKNGTK